MVVNAAFSTRQNIIFGVKFCKHAVVHFAAVFSVHFARAVCLNRRGFKVRNLA